MWRLNQRPIKDITILCKKDPNWKMTFAVEYLNEHTFNAYIKNEKGWLTPVLLEAEIDMHPNVPDEVFVRTDSEEYKVDYFMDRSGHVTTLDYEGYPLPYYVKHIALEEGLDDAAAISDHLKSPMPGTVAKLFVTPGQKVKAGDTIVAVESMKMEYSIKAEHEATIAEVLVNEGQFVEMKQRLVTFQE